MNKVKVKEVVKNYTLLILLMLIIGLLFYSFSKYKMYTIGGVVAISVIIYMLDYIRVFAFKINDIFKGVNETFWDLMMIINIIINNVWVRYSLAGLLFIVLFRLLYYMFNLM